MNRPRLDTCVIVGATGALGSHLARQLSENCKRLVLVGRDRRRLIELNSSLPPSACLFQLVELDLEMVDQSTGLLLDRAIPRRAAIDFLAVAAGSGCWWRVESMPLKVWERVIQVNLTAPFLLCQWAISRMKRHGRGGVIALVSSQAALEGKPGSAAYSAAKAGLLTMVQSLTKELKGDKIRILAEVPSLMDLGFVYKAIASSEPTLRDSLRRKFEGLPRPCPDAAQVASKILQAVLE